MKTIKVNHLYEIPENYTGIVEHSHPNGLKQWWLFNGMFHREDGPAVEHGDGAKFWYINNERHREDGPAVIDKSGDVEYWLNGKGLSKKDIDFLLNLGYPTNTAIKLVHFYENNKVK